MSGEDSQRIRATFGQVDLDLDEDPRSTKPRLLLVNEAESVRTIPGAPALVLEEETTAIATASPALLERLEARYGVPVLEAYGMTEASHEMASNPLPPGRRIPGTVGLPTGAEIRTVDREGNDVAPGSPGEVVIRGAGVMPGYLDNPTANAESFFGEWFRTGDQGVLEDGYLRLTGRIKEIIIRGGENISPIEVEEVLLRHPAVREAVAFGIPDEKYGETVGAALVVDEGTTEAEILAHCRAQLTAVKVPTTLHLLDAIPRTPTGKVQRRRMAAMLGHA